MFPSEATGFVPAAADVPLFTERVIVHTLSAPGVTPRSFAPPGYAQSTEGNYNTVAGYLENGNQRCVRLHLVHMLRLTLVVLAASTTIMDLCDAPHASYTCTRAHHTRSQTRTWRIHPPHAHIPLLISKTMPKPSR